MKNITELKQVLIKRDGLRCSLTGEAVTSPDELAIEHLLPRSKGGTDDLGNLMLIKKELNAAIGDDERRRTRIIVKELQQRQEELSAREAENFEREQTYRKQLELQERQLEDLKIRLRKEQAEREASFQAELIEERKRVREQQVQLQAHLQSSEMNFANQQNEFLQERQRLSQELQEREQLLKESLEELEREKKKYTEESRRKIESNSTTYVNDALKALDTAANKYHDISRNWSVIGVLSLFAGVSAATYFGLIGFLPLAGLTTVGWSQVVFFGFKGLIIIGLFVAIAKYCFAYGQSFMHESLKNSERKHAINFGKFYLESFGANAEWSQVKEAFEHWNIAPSSAFSNNDSDKFDPKTMERASQLIDSLGKLKPAKSGQDSERSA
jgi:hypothetical protein